jgi:hypothetical protein
MEQFRKQITPFLSVISLLSAISAVKSLCSGIEQSLVIMDGKVQNATVNA